MAKLNTLLLATAASALMISGASAQEMDSYGFPWSGYYAGVIGGLSQDVGDTGQYYSVGAAFGYNHRVSGDVLLGVEGIVSAYGGTWSGQEAFLVGRAGKLINDDILIYGQVAVGIDDLSETMFGVGAGVEAPVADNISVRLSAEYYSYTDSSLTPWAGVTGAILWHFGP